MSIKQLTDDEALALSGTTDADTGFPYPTLLQARWAEAILRGLSQFLNLFVSDLRVVEIASNADCIGVLPGTATIGASMLTYAGATGSTGAVDALTDNNTTLIWAYDNAGAMAIGSGLSLAGWPAIDHIKLATVTMSAGAITALVDLRGAVMLNSAAGLEAIAAISPALGDVLVGDGTTWQVENGATARASLGAAVSGTNSDITSLTGLTTALSIIQGGTGAITAAAALASLGAAASGVNADITSLTGLSADGIPVGVVAAASTAALGAVLKAAAAAVAALTDSTGGTAGATLGTTGDTSTTDQSATINSNFASLTARIDAIEAALQTAGIMG